MRIAKVIRDKEILWTLLQQIKKLDEQTFIVCLLGAYTGARFRELRSLPVKELRGKNIHLGTQLYRGTGRIVLVNDRIKWPLYEYCEKQKDGTKPVLYKDDGTFLTLLVANKVVTKAASELGLSGITVTSFRKTFGHKICQGMEVKESALDVTGFHFDSEVDLHTMFELEKGGWE